MEESWLAFREKSDEFPNFPFYKIAIKNKKNNYDLFNLTSIHKTPHIDKEYTREEINNNIQSGKYNIINSDERLSLHIEITNKKTIDKLKRLTSKNLDEFLLLDDQKYMKLCLDL